MCYQNKAFKHFVNYFDNKLTFRFIRLWDQPDDTAKSVVVKTELKTTAEERSMTAEQTSGDDDKVESEFHWLSDLGMNNNHTAMSLAVTRPTAG